MADAGMGAEVVVRIQEDLIPPPPSSSGTVNFTPPYPMQETQAVVIVRAEEVLLVVLVLMIWVAAIALFFNRWGKIRMLEPYQPKFQQSHRQSCPMAVDTAVNTGCSISDLRKQRMSFSKFNVNCLGDSAIYSALPSPRPLLRPRQNSVFAGSSTMAVMNNPPRRAKSAMDIQHLVLGEFSPRSLSGCSSMLPMSVGKSTSKEFSHLRDRRPSIQVERAQSTQSASTRHRASLCRDLSSHFPSLTSYRRRPSCFTDRPNFNRCSRFISFDQPSCSWERPDRRMSITVERSPTQNRNRPSISLERPPSWDRRPSFTVEPPAETEEIDEDQVIIEMEHIRSRVPLLKQTTISFDNVLPNNSFDSKSSNNSDQPLQMSYDRRPSFTLERPSPCHSIKRLSVSLDHPPLKWDDAPAFIIEKATPTPTRHNADTFLSSPAIELETIQSDTESKRVTNV